MNWEPEDNADQWKFTPPQINKNDMDYSSKVTVNTYSDVPFLVQDWKIRKEEPMRVDINHKNTYFSFVMGEKPYVEIYSCDEFGDIDQLSHVIELGDYLD